MTYPQGVTNAQSRSDYEGTYGWRTSILKEVKRVEAFGAWKPTNSKELNAARKHYPGQVSMGHIVMAFRVKTDADGTLKGGGVTKKSRIAFADEVGFRPTYTSTHTLDAQTTSQTA